MAHFDIFLNLLDLTFRKYPMYPSVLTDVLNHDQEGFSRSEECKINKTYLNDFALTELKSSYDGEPP